MTLDPIHVDEIGALARLIRPDVDDDEHDNVAETVWADALDPLSVDGEVVLEPLDSQERHVVRIDDIALTEPPFPTCHGLDAGTMNPTTFHNGAVVDIAHAAMARDPSDHTLHRHRSIVGTIHATERIGHITERWESFDEDYGRRTWLQAPRTNRFAEGVVHTICLYYAESSHAHAQLDAVEDLLLLDGPIYPKELLRWDDRHAALRELLLGEELPTAIVQAYLDLVSACIERDLPVAGFVKNPSSNRLTRAIRRAGYFAPWFNDAGFFRRVLDPSDAVDDPEAHLACTSWFCSRAGTDRTFGANHEPGLDLRRPGDLASFEVTFMVVLDPRDRMIYRVEAPRGVTCDPATRTALTEHILRSIAAERGPPTAIRKADQLARIGRGQKRALRRTLEREWDTRVEQTYDDLRWGTE